MFPKNIYWSRWSPKYSWMWPYLEINKVFIDKNQVKVKSLVWALIQCDQLPYMNTWRYRDTRRRPWAIHYQQCQKWGKLGMKQPSWETSREHESANILISDFILQKYERISSDCFKPPSLWNFVTIALGNWYSNQTKIPVFFFHFPHSINHFCPMFVQCF